MMVDDEIRAQVAAWHKMEDKFYGSVLNLPELYMAGIRLVRALADSLDHVREVEALLDVYRESDISHVISIADSLAIPQLSFINYELARDAAFYLRYQEIVEAKTWAETQERLAEARAKGAAWVVLYDNETQRYGQPFFQRLEMHLPDGIGLYTAIELDWEKGRLYVVEPVVLDPATGKPQAGVPPPDPRQEFTTREELLAAVATLRQKYSSGGSQSEADSPTSRGSSYG